MQLIVAWFMQFIALLICDRFAMCGVYIAKVWEGHRPFASEINTSSATACRIPTGM